MLAGAIDKGVPRSDETNIRSWPYHDRSPTAAPTASATIVDALLSLEGERDDVPCES